MKSNCPKGIKLVSVLAVKCLFASVQYVFGQPFSFPAWTLIQLHVAK